MNSELLARLMEATPEERSWLLTEAALESLSPELRQAVWAVVVPHWFDAEILAALCPELAGRSEELYSELQALSFVERFGERGHNIHEATRKMLLDKLWQDKPEEFRAISKLAADYFANNETNRAEWLYHKLVLKSETTGNDGDFDRVMESLDYGYQRSEAEVVLLKIQEQITSNRVNRSVLAQTAYWEGRVLDRSYEQDAAFNRYKASIELYREVNDQLGEAHTLQAIGDVFQFKDRHDEALENYKAAIGLYREVGDRLGEANALRSIGNVLQFKNRRDEALENYKAAIGLDREVGNRLGEANALQAIGDVFQFKNRLDKALENYQQAIGLYREVGDRLGEANSLQAIGNVLQFKDRLDEALENYQQAIGLYREVGDRLGEANSLQTIGDVLQFKDCLDEALDYYQQAIGLYREVGDRLGEANCIQEFGNLEENVKQKLQFFQEAQQIYVVVDSQYSQSRNLRFIARTYESLNNPEFAIQSWTESRDIAISINYEPFQTSAQEAIDRLLGN